MTENKMVPTGPAHRVGWSCPDSPGSVDGSGVGGRSDSEAEGRKTHGTGTTGKAEVRRRRRDRRRQAGRHDRVRGRAVAHGRRPARIDGRGRVQTRRPRPRLPENTSPTPSRRRTPASKRSGPTVPTRRIRTAARVRPRAAEMSVGWPIRTAPARQAEAAGPDVAVTGAERSDGRGDRWTMADRPPPGGVHREAPPEVPEFGASS